MSRSRIIRAMLTGIHKSDPNNPLDRLMLFNSKGDLIDPDRVGASGDDSPARPAVLLGGIPTGNPTLQDYLVLDAKLAPAHLDMLLLFNGWAGPLIWGGNQTVSDNLGAQLLISWQPSVGAPVAGFDGTLGDVVHGEVDAYLDTSIAAIKAWGGPVTIRLAHELNGNWTSYGTAKESAQSFIDGWQYIVKRFRDAGVSNVQWCWSATAWGRHASGPVVDPTAYYPGDAYVDVIGLDGYQNLKNPDNPNRPDDPTDWPEDVFLGSYTAAAAMSKRPIMISEVGVAEDARFSKAEWWKRFFVMISEKMPRLVAVCVWTRTDKLDEADQGDYSLDSSGANAASLAAFVRGVNSPPFMTPNGAQMNGQLPKPPASKPLRPMASQSRLWLPDGVKPTSWLSGTQFKVKDANFSLSELAGNDIRLIDGQSLFFEGPLLREGEIYSKAVVHTGTQASVAPTRTVFALFDTSANLLAIAEYLTAIGATGLIGGWTFTPIRMPRDTITYGMLMQKGGSAMLDIRGRVGQATAFAASPRTTGFGPAGLTDIASIQTAMAGYVFADSLIAPSSAPNVLPWVGVGR